MRRVSRCACSDERSRGVWQRLTRAFSEGSNHDLPRPQILYTNNHLVVVNKPPGWHSMPATNDQDTKSLVAHLQHARLGGGSQQTFLSPLHRIDQPCSGVLLLAKTARMASRIQSNWKQVQKQYLCVLDHNVRRNVDRLADASQPVQHDNSHHSDDWMELTGEQVPPTSRRTLTRAPSSSSQLKGWSVTMLPVDASSLDSSNQRRIQWRFLGDDQSLLLVETNQGSRHMIRSLLGMVDCPIAGDLRYGATQPLPDRSVALHARRLVLPQHLAMGQDNVVRDFCAPIPDTWDRYFGMTEPQMQTHMAQTELRPT